MPTTATATPPRTAATPTRVLLGKERLTAQQVHAVAHYHAPLHVDPGALQALLTAAAASPSTSNNNHKQQQQQKNKKTKQRKHNTASKPCPSSISKEAAKETPHPNNNNNNNNAAPAAAGATAALRKEEESRTKLLLEPTLDQEHDPHKHIDRYAVRALLCVAAKTLLVNPTAASTTKTKTKTKNTNNPNAYAAQVVQTMAIMLNVGIVPAVLPHNTPNLDNNNHSPTLRALLHYLMPTTDKATKHLPVWFGATITTLQGALGQAGVNLAVTAKPAHHDLTQVLALMHLAPDIALVTLAVHATTTTTMLADCVAAFTCEALQVHTQPFDPALHDFGRPHKGTMDAANALRWLLRGSKSTDAAAASRQHTPDPQPIRDIPSLHGLVRAPLREATRAVHVELNATAKATCALAGHIHHAPLTTANTALVDAMAIIASSSIDRLQTMLTCAGTEGYGPLASSTEQATIVKEALQAHYTALHTASVAQARRRRGSVHHAQHALDTTTTLAAQALATELAAAAQILAVREDALKAAAEKAAACKKERAGKRDAAASRAPEVTEKKKKKWAQKAAKAAAARQAAAGSGAAGSILAMGSGSEAFRAYIIAQAPTVKHAHATAAAVDKAIACLLQATCSSQHDLRQFLESALTVVNKVVQAKEAKGTRDTVPRQMAIREKAFAIIRGVFFKHGAVGIDTPVFERREVLTGKYGEDSKLIYNLEDQGGEMLSLRYDLTVPFARYCATHKIDSIKRYHMARVYRRDQPAFARGRFREFYQCDFDIAGASLAPMVPDAEVLKVLADILSGLKIGRFKIKLNHRGLLDGIMAVCGVPAEKFRPICSAIDKLDKEPWNVVREEMTVTKGLDGAVADRIGIFVNCAPEESAHAQLDLLRKDAKYACLSGNESCTRAMDELALLFEYLEAFQCLDVVSFDLSLARGLDYYTGIIYEAVLLDGGTVGSVAAGGRYDNLVGMFSSKQLPAVGVSIGVERLLAVLEQRAETAGGIVRTSQTEVLVASVGKHADLLRARMEVCQLLWDSGIKAEFLHEKNPKPKRQMDYAVKNGIPVVAWIGEDEMQYGDVSLKHMLSRTERTVKRDVLVSAVRDALCSGTVDGSARTEESAAHCAAGLAGTEVEIVHV